MSNTPPDQAAIQEKKSELLDMFDRMLPLVDGMADSIRFAMLLGFALVAWIGIWLFFLKDFSLGISLMVAGVAVLPVLLLLRFWWALEELKRLPDIVTDMMDDARDEVQETVQGIRAGNVQKLGLLGSVRNLWKVGSLAGEARSLLGSYISIGTLVNPLSLILGILSLLFVPLLAVVGIILLVLAF